VIIIHFQNGAEWCKASWVFRQFRADVAAAFATDVELTTELERADALGLLPLDSVDQALASRVVRAMRAVAQETVAGKTQGWLESRPTDREGQRMYLEAISELLDFIKQQPSNS
jgi:hypothetical protein